MPMELHASGARGRGFDSHPPYSLGASAAHFQGGSSADRARYRVSSTLVVTLNPAANAKGTTFNPEVAGENPAAPRAIASRSSGRAPASRKGVVSLPFVAAFETVNDANAVGTTCCGFDSRRLHWQEFRGRSSTVEQCFGIPCRVLIEEEHHECPEQFIPPHHRHRRRDR